MTRFKDFGTDIIENAEPITFKLYGEEFTCVPQVQGKILLTLAANAKEDRAAESAEMVLKFFKEVLEDESYERFDALLSDKRKPVRVEKLGEIVGWLMEEYTNRPEGPSGVS